MEITESLEKKLLRTKEGEATSLVLARWAATGLGIGFLPLAPGTWASLVTASAWFGLYALMGGTAIVVLISFLCLFVPLAWISGGIAARGFGEEDPSVVVIDEVVGQTITLLFVPVSLWYFIGAFALFRFFDITKPPPVRRCERLPGGLGILMDDCVAGIYAGLTILGIRIILHAM